MLLSTDERCAMVAAGINARNNNGSQHHNRRGVQNLRSIARILHTAGFTNSLKGCSRQFVENFKTINRERLAAIKYYTA